MNLVQISDYRTLHSTAFRDVAISYDDPLAADELIIVELTNDGRAYINKVRVAPVDDDTPPFKPLFHSWLGDPCNWKG